MHRGVGEWRRDGVLPPLAFQKGWTGAEAFFRNSIIGNSKVYKDRLETNLLQLFGHPGNSEWFSIIFVIIFEVNIVDE